MKTKKNNLPLIISILDEACSSFGYSFNNLDDNSNMIFSVSNGKKTFFSSVSGIYPLNPSSNSKLVKDKVWTSMFLRSKGYKVPSGNHFFTIPNYLAFDTSGKEIEDALVFADSIGYPVFVKPNSCSQGLFAEIDYSPQEVRDHFDQISEVDHIAIVQEKITGLEYRIFVSNGEPQFAYSKSACKIIGNGKQNVLSLIDIVNQNIQKTNNQINPSSIYLKNHLAEQGLSLNSFLKIGEELKVSSKKNLSAGGEIIDYTENFSDLTIDWAKELVNCLGLGVVGIDVFVQDSINKPDGFTIIEVNNNPGLSGIYKLGKKEKVMDIWKKILETYFN